MSNPGGTSSGTDHGVAAAVAPPDQAELVGPPGSPADRFGELFDSFVLGVAISGPDGRIVRTNPALDDILGYRAGELLGRELADLVVPDTEPAMPASHRRLLAGDLMSGELISDEQPWLRTAATLRRKDGETTWTRLTISVLTGTTGAPRYLAITIQDVTEVHLLTQRLTHQALHDLQTGLPNRQFFVSHLEMVLGRLDPSVVITLLHLDLDGFSVLNQGLGHRAGDRVLNVMARRLESAVADRQAMVARLGGDEYAVLIEPGHSAPDVGVLAETINTRLAQPLDLGGVQVALTATIGVVQQQVGETGTAELMRAAAATLGRLRDKGRRQWGLYDPDADAAHRTELRLAATLPGALENHELQVLYRPVVALDSGRLVGAEAELAWRHPRLGLLAQDRCLQLAERTGVVHAIGQHMLHSAAEQARSWHRQHGAAAPPVMINLSLTQAQDPDLVAKVRTVLGGTGIRPAALELRVPVQAIRMVDGPRSGPAGEEAEDNLRVLAELGVRTALHDFGGDVAALACLTEPWVHAVRIAEAISTQLSDNPAGLPARALRALLPTMRGNRVSVLASAVDNERLAAQWRGLGADCGTGALFGHPRPAGDLARMLGAGPGG